MTKNEAKICLHRGLKISHSYYTSDEFIYMKKGIIYTEEDYPMGTINDEFWNKIQKWADGWKIYNK